LIKSYYNDENITECPVLEGQPAFFILMHM